MRFADAALRVKRPDNVRRSVVLPRRQSYYRSPIEWRDEVLYFLLVDRFSDGEEDISGGSRPLLDRQNPQSARPATSAGGQWLWNMWAESGTHWQGGTLKGVRSKIGYLKQLGVTAIWLSPIFKQRSALTTYHGYGIQDFLDVDPRFGNRRDLSDLISAAHADGLRIILDVVFNHSGANWVYPGGVRTPPYKPFPQRYDFGYWLGAQEQPATPPFGDNDAVWPNELQNTDYYTRAGKGDLGAGDINDPNAEHKRSDFEDLRDFNLDSQGLLTDLALCYKYWIALTDCDGFRIDTLKHVTLEQARNFCGTIKEFAANLGKKSFFLAGEIAGGDYNENFYLNVLARNLNAALDIGEMRPALNGVSKGLLNPSSYFDGFDIRKAILGSHRNLGDHHVSILDDHDHVFGEKLRFSSEASSVHQVVAGVALQLFTLGIPCIYYGTEQAFGGPESSERKWLPEWGISDRYLREAMFGPEHPKDTAGNIDSTLPGFGPFGTASRHCFDEKSSAYVRIAALTALRREYPVLRYGRQYLRPTSFLGKPFDFYGPGEVIAWSRILDGDEAVCIVNSHGTDERGANVLVDAELNSPDSQMTVILNTAQAATPQGYTGTHPVSSTTPIIRSSDGAAYIEIRGIQASEVIVLTNHPEAEEGAIKP